MTAILCPISKFEKSYSVAQIVENQLDVFPEATLITTSDFKESVVNEVRMFPRWITSEGLEEYYQRVKESLTECFLGVEVCLIHDVFFIEGFMHLNYAIRRLNPSVKFIVWSHSLTGQQYTGLNYQPYPNAVYVALTPYMVKGISERYSVPEEEVIVLPHFTKPPKNPMVRCLYDNYDLNKYDLVCVYPTRIAEFKGIHKIVFLLSLIEKTFKWKTLLIVPNSYATTIQQLVLMDNCKDIETSIKGYSNMIFMSQVSEQFKITTDHETVRSLLDISNLFIMPSTSESFSLIVLEAIQAKIPLILNSDVPTFQFFKEYEPLYLPFNTQISTKWFKHYRGRLYRFLSPIVSRRNKDKLLNYRTFLLRSAVM